MNNEGAGRAKIWEAAARGSETFVPNDGSLSCHLEKKLGSCKVQESAASIRTHSL